MPDGSASAAGRPISARDINDLRRWFDRFDPETLVGASWTRNTRDWHSKSGWDVQLVYATGDPSFSYTAIGPAVKASHDAGRHVLVRLDYARGQSLPPENDSQALATYLQVLQAMCGAPNFKNIAYGYIIGNEYNSSDENTLMPAKPSPPSPPPPEPPLHYGISPEWYARVFNGYGTPVGATDNAIETVRAVQSDVWVLVGAVAPYAGVAHRQPIARSHRSALGLRGARMAQPVAIGQRRRVLPLIALLFAVLLPRVGPLESTFDVMAMQGLPQRPSLTDQGRWLPVTAMGGPGVFGGQAVWADRELLVWGGIPDPDGEIRRAGGARYDPSTGQWSRMTGAGAPSFASQLPPVWTGHEMIIWSWIAPSQRDSTGGPALYRPATDTWRPISLTDAPDGVTGITTIWTGREYLVWGGRASRIVDPAPTSARYDPAADTWRPIATAGAPSLRLGHTAVWTGREMVVWGGSALRNSIPFYYGDGGRYDPATDTWAPLSITGAPTPRRNHTAVWTGREMLIWGGTIGADDAGGRYDPATDTWRPIPPPGLPLGWRKHTAVWTGREMVIWGGELAADRYGVFRPGEPGVGARYDPRTDAWSPLPLEGAPVGRCGAAGAWTGAELIIWGGNGSCDDGPWLGDGGRYTPPADRPVGPFPAPAQRP